jgi:DNA-binding beta-propeller fold protein YncE
LIEEPIQADVHPRVFKSLTLVKTIQAYNASKNDVIHVYDSNINSPKSANFTLDGKKFYIQSLEGYETVVYDATSFDKIKVIRHEFNASNAQLFKNGETTIFNYPFKQTRKNYNHFLGKPVESCLSHDGRYLWVTYYRRDFDPTASSPSAVAIIDTEKDEIVRVMPCGPLPKMIACSPDNKSIAVTHWGDNTVAIIDISSPDVMDFEYTHHLDIDRRLVTNFSSGVNRDSECGNCLRGTVFTPDGRFILIAKMGGNGLAVVRTSDMKYLGTITGSKLNLRHVVIENEQVFISSNKFGVVQSMPLSFLDSIGNTENESPQFFPYESWKSVSVGSGARTIELTPDGKYIIACVNNESKVVVVEVERMNVIFTTPVSKFPVGLAISPDGNYAVVTSQGKSSVQPSGNAVNIYRIDYE